MGRGRKSVPDVMGGLLGGKKVSRRGGRSGDRDAAGRAPETEVGHAPLGPPAEDAARKNATFYLTREVQRELEDLYLRLRTGGVEGVGRKSKSEIVEAALRAALEDARERGADSPVMERLNS